jgi:hypothetical protein
MNGITIKVEINGKVAEKFIDLQTYEYAETESNSRKLVMSQVYDAVSEARK